MAQFGNKRQTSLINWDTSGPSDDLHWLSWECESLYWENTTGCDKRSERVKNNF